MPKEIAQIGAVLGREFAYELIEPVAQRPERELQAALGQLSDAGLLFCRGTAPHASYLFKHALVQDAAYGTLLRGRRQELHARVAAVLEQHFADLVERQPELLAHHLTAAGDTERAVDQWLKAGQHAAARSAHLEAIRISSAVSRHWRHCPKVRLGTDGRSSCNWPEAYRCSRPRGSSSAGAGRAYTRARELAEQRGDPRQLFMAAYGLWQSANGAGRILDCRSLSSGCSNLLQATPTTDCVCRRITAPGQLICSPASRRCHASTARRGGGSTIRSGTVSTIYSTAGTIPACAPATLVRRSIGCSGIPIRAWRSAAKHWHWPSGYPHPFSLTLAFEYNAMVHLDRGEPELGLQRLEAAEALAAEQRLSFVVEPRLLRGAALTRARSVRGGCRLFARGACRGPARRGCDAMVSPSWPTP